MNWWNGVALCSGVLALVPVLLIWRNLSTFVSPPAGVRRFPGGVSVLIPARNEEANIEAALQSALRNNCMPMEVLVADDHSTDATAAIVRRLAEIDPRVRLIQVPPLPFGWCGKQYACQVLGEQATHPLLLFMDADVRLGAEAVSKMTAFLTDSGADLISGIPRQETRTFWEKLLVPLIHFVLLGFLPIRWMRTSDKPAFAAGCGQLFMARFDAYRASGSHRTLRCSLHDGLHLPRAFRVAGFRTDLFDATDVASCRMYQDRSQVWRGLARNAQEALGSPSLIGPATLFLAGGQVLPFLLLAFAPSPLIFNWAALTVLFILTTRLQLAFRFRQSIVGALLHPLGIGALLAIQWFAVVRSVLKHPSRWRDRSYLPAPVV